MPRRPNIIPSARVWANIPLDLKARLDLWLHSDLEGKRPFGSYQKLFIQLLKDFFDHKNLDLGPYIGCLPGIYIVRGSPQTIARLKLQLEKHHVQS